MKSKEKYFKRGYDSFWDRKEFYVCKEVKRDKDVEEFWMRGSDYKWGGRVI